MDTPLITDLPKYSPFQSESRLFFYALIALVLFIISLFIFLSRCYYLLHRSALLFQQLVLSPQLAERSNLMPTSTSTTYLLPQLQILCRQVQRWAGVCYGRVNIHQEATRTCACVCVLVIVKCGTTFLFFFSRPPRVRPRLPCDGSEMEVCCRSEWGCNYFLTSLSASKPSHSALQLMRCPCGIVMLSK